MNNLMLNYIQDNWTNEEVDLYVDIMELIHGVKEDYTDNIQSMILSLPDETPTDALNDLIRSSVQEILIDLLLNIGVIVSDDYPLENEVLFKIYREMIGIEANEQIDFSLSILGSEEDNVVVFFELLNTVGCLDLDESVFNTHVSKILPQTKNKLVNYLRNQKLVENKKPSEVDLNEISLRVKHFIREVNDDNFFVVDLIRKGVNIGLPFESYMSLYGEELFELDLKEQCYNLYLFALISSDGTDAPAEKIEAEIGNYVLEMDVSDKIIRAVREVQIKTRRVS